MCKQLRCVVLLVLVLGLGTEIAGAAGLKPDLLWWTFDEGTGTVAYDASGSGHDGTVEGSPTWVTGKMGGALEFSGAGGERVVDDDAGDYLNGLDAVTIAIWIKSGETGSDRGFIIGEEPDGGDNIMEMRYDAAGATAGGTNVIKMAVVAPNDEQQLESSENLQTTEWQHVAMVWSRNEQLQLYVDGELDTPTANDDPRDVSTSDVSLLIVGQGGKDSGRSWIGLIDDVQIYSRALSAEEIQNVMAGLGDFELADNPVPADEATDVLRDVVLGWTAGEYAATHDVYLGTAADDVNAASRSNPMDLLISQGQSEMTLDAGRLELGQTYYWRVDEVNAAPDSTIFTGNLWSFTVEPVAYPIEGVIATCNVASDVDAGPENMVNGSGLDANDGHSVDSVDMWLTQATAEQVTLQYEFDQVYKLYEMLVWNYNVMFETVLGFGLKEVTIEYSEDGETWTALGDVELAQATSAAGYVANTTVDFAGAAARFVRITVNDNWGSLTQYGLSEVRFLYVPVAASEPQPNDGQANVDPATTLAWRAGREADTHEVYLGTDPEALALLDTVTEPTVTPAVLEFGTSYFWKVNEVNEAETPTSWESSTWSFQTQEFATIDDFESYDNDENAIFETWTDGWVNGSGSTAGYLSEPFAETTIVNGGAQSMPLIYDNSASPSYSEVERDLGGRDLDSNGANTLRLFVAGQTPPFVETDDGTILMSAIGADIWNASDEFRYAYMNLSGDGSIIAQIDGLYRSNEWVKGGVMIRESIQPGSTFAAVYLTGDYGVRFQARPTVNDSAASDSSVATDEQIALEGPVWVKIERIGDTFNGYYSTDGENWTTMVWSPQTIAMAGDVTIGLALTSHDSSISTGAAFSGITTTGNVSGNWQTAEIGGVQPTEIGNSIEPLYVALEDSTGNVAVVTHPNAAAAGIARWQEWLIPYSDLAGINLNNVRTIYVGVGDRDNPTSGGTGTIFVDDIGFGKPVSADQ